MRVEYSGATSGGVRLPFRLNGKPLSANLDTGATSTTVTRAGAATAGVDVQAQAGDPTHSLVGVGNEQTSATAHRFTEMSIGTERFRNPVLTVYQTAALASAGSAAAGSDVLVGEDWLATRRIWLSTSSHRMYVQQRAPAGPTPPRP